MSNKIINGFEIVHNLIKLRWIPEIVKSIYLGNIRYSEIQRSIPYLSHTELTRKLNALMAKGVIKKAKGDIGDYYSLESFGRDLVHIFYHLEDLEEKYLHNHLLNPRN